MSLYGSPPVAEYPIPGLPIVSNLCTASDGNLWFSCEGGVPELGRITPQGIISLYPVGASGDNFGGINPGSDGNVYLADTTAHTVYQVATTGASVGGVVGSASLPCAGLVCGSDGNMWVMDSGGNHVNRLSPQGSITTFTPPTGGAFPHGPNLGYDGNVWFCEQNKAKIAYVTPQGAFTEFPIAGASSPYWVNRGPDGDYWFTDIGTGKVGRITPQGLASLYTVPTASAQPGGIWAASDGRVYFTEKAANQIGVIRPYGGIPGTIIQTKSGQGAGGAVNVQFDNPVGPSSTVVFFAAETTSAAQINPPAGFAAAASPAVRGAFCAIQPFYNVGGMAGATQVGASGSGTMYLQAYELAALFASPIGASSVANVASSNSISIGAVTPPTPYSVILAGIILGAGGLAFQNAWTSGFTRDDVQTLATNRSEWAHLATGSQVAISTTETFGASVNAAAAAIVINLPAPFALGQARITEIGIPTPASNPDKVVLGPDGQLWFTEHDTGKIAVLTPTQWVMYNGPRGVDEQIAGDTYFTKLTPGASVAAPIAIASQMAAGDPSWWTFL